MPRFEYLMRPLYALTLMFHAQKKIGLMSNLVEFTWVTGVEGAVRVEYAHPTPLGRRECREGHGSCVILGRNTLVFQMMQHEVCFQISPRKGQYYENKTKNKSTMFEHIELHPNDILYMFRPMKTFASKSMATAIDRSLMFLRSIGG